MQYSQFISKIRSAGVAKSVSFHGHTISESNGVISIDGVASEFTELEEAKQFIKSKNLSEQIEEQVSKELYEEISETTVAALIREHHDVKVTDTLIEKYINLASSHTFTVDPVIQEIRSMNKLDRLVEGKLHYVLDDHSIVAIDEATQSKLNSILREQNEVIEYMRTSKENFLNALNQIEDKDGDR
jgi:hypothetical protein